MLPPASELGSLEAALQLNAAELRHAGEAEEVRRELRAAQGRAAGLEAMNAQLMARLQAVLSEFPAQQVAYEQLQRSFYQVQAKYVGAAREAAQLRQEVAVLRAQLAAAAAAAAERGA